MSIKKVVLFGSKEALSQTRAQKIRSALDKLGHEIVLLPSPKILQSFSQWKQLVFDWCIFMVEENKPIENYEPWEAVFSQLQTKPLMASWTFEELPFSIKKIMKPAFEFTKEHAFGDVLQSLGLSGSVTIKSELLLNDVDINLMELSQKVSEEEITGLNTGAFLEDRESLSMVQPESASLFETEVKLEEPKIRYHNLDDLLKDESEETNLNQLPQNEIGTSSNLNEESLFLKEIEDELKKSKSIQEPLKNEKSLSFVELDEASEVSEPSAVSLQTHYPQVGKEDVETIKRYAALKEREAREKNASLVALKNEYEKCRQKLLRSDNERRRLMLELEETRVKLNTANDLKEESQHHVSKMDQHFQEQIKDLQIRLESAQFQAAKSERKLEEFRDRVRNDIQRIRVRERELANRLELQKRDAEALLTVKDEKLLQQKRELDRLQFEVETMREKLEEEVDRSDERSKKLSRALQSLKLAQGMLSGLEDSELDSSQSGEDEAA